MEESPQLSNWTIFRFYYPLAVSWLFMGLEGPVCEGVINRMRRPEINAAAWPIMLALAVWIESPVIDLLSTSTTLSKNRQSYEVISRFVWYLLGWVTLAHALIVLTPLYDIVARDILGVHAEVAKAARLGLIIYLPWSAMIGWRRYLQGILIRFDRTRTISLGTTARVTTLVVLAIGLYKFTDMQSVLIAAIAIVTSVCVEAGFIHVMSRDVIALHFGGVRDSNAEPLTMRKLVGFHIPLSATTMVNLLVMPMVSAGLARTNHPVLALAGYGVATAILFLHRAVTFCLPEVVITLYKSEATMAKLRNFSLGVGAISSGIILVTGLTGLDRYIFQGLIDARPQIAEMAHACYLLSAAVPLVDAAQAYLRGILTAHHLTVSRLIAVLAAIVILISTMILGVALKWPAPVMASVTVTCSLLAELAVLAFAWARAKDTHLAVATH